jgi:kynurenine formamidase
MGPAALPRFDDLPEIPGLGLRRAWHVFGPDDRVGTVNLLTPDRVRAGVACVRSGEVVSLDLPLDEPNPPFFGRQPYGHHVFALSRNEMDDRVDNLHLQGSTQWDALGHVRCREHGYYGGVTDDPTAGTNPLGIDRWAARGIAGRAVLVDLAGWAAAAGRPFDPLGGTVLGTADLDAALEAQDTTLEPGDIVCLRFGWVGAYRTLDAAARVAYAPAPTFAGLSAAEATARWLWDHHVAALVCDNPAVEVVPGDPQVGSLHRRLIPCLGLALGEMFDLETLAERCRARGDHTFLFTAAPLKVPGGVGSPGNALAIL